MGVLNYDGLLITHHISNDIISALVPLGGCHGNGKVLAHNTSVQSLGHQCQHTSSPRIPGLV